MLARRLPSHWRCPLAWDIVFSYNSSADAAEETKREIEALGRRVLARKLDAGNVAECQELVEAAVASFGRLDVLVNSASLWKRTKFADLGRRIGTR